MLDIYGRAGKVGKAEDLFAKLDKKDMVKLTMMIRAYAKSDRPEEATEMLHNLLKNPKAVVKNSKKTETLAHVFTGVIDAWAESSHPDAFARGQAIFRLMETDACRLLGVSHCVTSYGAMLKCIARSLKRKDAGERAEALLNEMEERNLSPNEM